MCFHLCVGQANTRNDEKLRDQSWVGLPHMRPKSILREGQERRGGMRRRGVKGREAAERAVAALGKGKRLEVIVPSQKTFEREDSNTNDLLDK